jgi:hypothetical protein
MPATEGAKTWIVPDGYLPTPPADGQPYQSHEAVCILNTEPRDARVLIDVFFEDRDPLKDLAVTVPGERTFHVRLDKPEHLGGATLPRDTPYAIRLRSDVPIVVQHSRLDTTQPNLTLMTTIAFPVG